MKQFKSARLAGVPLIGIETSDPEATMQSCIAALNGKGDSTPIVQWDAVRGCTPVNKLGAEVMKEDGIDPQNTLNIVMFLGEFADIVRRRGNKLVCDIESQRQGVVLFIHMGNRLISEWQVAQAVWNLRDIAKANGITVVLLGPSIKLPEELKHDVIVISDPLPGEDELKKVVLRVVDDYPVKTVKEQAEKEMPRIVDTLRGLSAFSAEQCLAMSLGKAGIDVQNLIRLKRGYISQLPGVEVREDTITFDDIAGYDNVKAILRRKIQGKRPPRLVIWWDEFDRTIAGNQSDTSGVTQDQVACLLSWAQDRLNENRLSAAILVGVPGAGKSAVASAARNEAQCECMRWDMGGMKDSLVGSSEKRIREVLKVTDAMSGGHILMIATCNSLAGVPAPIISRFALGTYYFDTPAKAEVSALWSLYRKKYDIASDQPNPSDAPLTGREIKQCCFLADDLQIPLAEALKYITPYYATNAKEIESLRQQAHMRWLSASYPGFFKWDGYDASLGVRTTPQQRRMAVAE